jgi:GINS complex subunit 2
VGAGLDCLGLRTGDRSPLSFRAQGSRSLGEASAHCARARARTLPAPACAMQLYKQSSFLPGELEFMAENELVEIRPTQSQPRLHLVCGHFGPFTAGISAHVPLWLARTLMEGGRARLVFPEWLRKKGLEDKIREEREEENLKRFTDVPFRYVELGEVLLREAEEECIEVGAKPNVIAELLQELQSVREEKISTFVKERLKDNSALGASKLDFLPIQNLSTMEISALREGFIKVIIRRRRCAHLSSRSTLTPAPFSDAGRDGGALSSARGGFQPKGEEDRPAAGRGRRCARRGTRGPGRPCGHQAEERADGQRANRAQARGAANAGGQPGDG